MTNATANPSIQTQHLRSRLWRDLWLTLPEWFRIGCWAVLAGLFVYVLIAIRIGIGLMESAEIQRVRQEGGIVLYPWRKNPEPFRGSTMISDGLWGRSTRNVHAVIMPNKSADKVDRCLTEFPNLKVVVLTDVPIQVNEFFYTNFCLMMTQNHTTPPPVVIGYGWEYDAKNCWKRLDIPADLSK